MPKKYKVEILPSVWEGLKRIKESAIPTRDILSEVEFAAIMEEGLKQAKSDESMTVKEAFSGLRAGI